LTALPMVSGKEAVRAFERLGWEVARQRGSHIIMVRAGYPATLSVPDHSEIAKGTLRSLIRAAGSTVAGFEEAARRG
jgi:predicted RNA binding protein YcfA (HicA-like mRNA interferase family)